ncbi:MAG: hypothetical protein H0W14_00480 [Actinobacteria bacterium]|nr:hypothetical protein [Actinomycetota bacterium]
MIDGWPERDRIQGQIDACRRKRKFNSEREADDAAYTARMEGRSLGIYKCNWCGGWHLTSRTDPG